MPNLFGEWEQTPQALKNLLTDADVHENFVPQLETFAAHIMKLVDSSPDIAIYRTVRQDNAQSFYYGYSHALHTGVLCVLTARRLRWPPARVQTLLKAALTMNLSILDLQGEMAGQDVPMRERQQAEIRSHPEDTVAMLQKWGVSDTEWLQAVAQHHEHPDGTGYPKGCADMGEMALAPQEAVRQLYREDHGGHPVARTLKHDTSQAEFAIVGTAGHPAMLARLPPERLYGFAKVQTG